MGTDVADPLFAVGVRLCPQIKNVIFSLNFLPKGASTKENWR
jgi:hypothetical protein